jgi:hypothetical protein
MTVVLPAANDFDVALKRIHGRSPIIVPSHRRPVILDGDIRAL